MFIISLHFRISSCICRSHANSLAMVVDISLFCISQSFNVGLHDDVNKGLEQIEEEPDVNHLDIGCLGQVVAHIDKHCRQDKHHSHIHGDYSLKAQK